MGFSKCLFSVAVWCVACGAAGAQVYYPAEAAFSLLDLEGDAQVQEVEDANIPLPDSTRALDIQGGKVIALVNGEEPRAAGTLSVLYREMAPGDADADGILLFAADYPMDLSEAHNVKQMRRQVWLEVDGDSGLHFRGAQDGGEEVVLTKPSGLKLVTDDWNETNWLWQKVRFGGGAMRGKCWPAHLPEPEGWDVEAEYETPPGRFGFRIGSGHVRVAYYAAGADAAGLRQPPEFFLYPPRERTAGTTFVPLWLYSNFDQAPGPPVELSVHCEGERIARISRDIALATGPQKTEFVLTSTPSERGEQTVRLRPNPRRGTWTVRAEVGETADSAKVEVVDTAEIEAKLDAAAAVGEAVEAQFDGPDAIPGVVAVLLDVADDHLEYARELLAAGEVDEAVRTMEYAVRALGELRGPKGALLAGRAGLLEPLPETARHPAQGQDGIRVVYDPAWRIQFGAPELEAQAMVMGQRYTARVPVRVLGGAPGRALVFEAELRSPYGHRTPAKARVEPDPPATEWAGDSEHSLEFTLDIAASDAKPLTPEPLVLDEYHDLILRAADAESGAPVILANDAGRHHDYPGTGYSAAKVYVAHASVEIRGFTPEDTAVNGLRRDPLVVRFLEGAPDGLVVLFTATAANGETVFQAVQPVAAEADASRELVFEWTPSTAGVLELRAEVLDGTTTLTEARRDVLVAPPVPIQTGKHKETVHLRGTEYATEVPVEVGQMPDAAVKVYADGRLVGEGAPGNIRCEPWFGYYDVVVEGGDWRYIERIVATVVETRGLDLVVNGEPFLVKGVNVHGMDSRSPERTRVMMRILKDRNFNMLRGDYPPPWQMDMAYDMNLVYTVLAPFSCASTNEVFARQDGPPLVTAREMSRAMVDRYAESAGVMLWNSCNEIVDELQNFLVGLYPVYPNLDPYRRPVHYANLYGQHAWRGQDLVGLNYYFGVGERVEDRHPIILRSIEAAHGHGLPVFYNEFNSWYGAIPETGVEALRGLFEWGNAQGLTGGIFYFRFNSDRHPGVFGGDYNTHKLIDEALHHAFDDARVSLAYTGGAPGVRVKNHRKFALRQVRVAFDNGTEQPLPDLPPGETLDVPVPAETAGPEVRGAVHYVTHYGFAGKAPFRLLVR